MNNFIFIGDSLTYGYGLPQSEGWVYRLSQLLPSINIINKGINGDTTASMLDRFYTDVATYTPLNIFIMGGTNDLLCGRSISLIIDNIEELILEGLQITPNIIIGIPPFIIKDMAEKLFMPSSFYSYCENSLPILKEKLITLSVKYAIKYIDFYTLTINNLDNIFSDGIHLNFLGNTLLLNEMIKVLNI